MPREGTVVLSSQKGKLGMTLCRLADEAVKSRPSWPDSLEKQLKADLSLGTLGPWCLVLNSVSPKAMDASGGFAQWDAQLQKQCEEEVSWGLALAERAWTVRTLLQCPARTGPMIFPGLVPPVTTHKSSAIL